MSNVLGPYQIAPGGGGSSPTGNYASSYFDTTAVWTSSTTAFSDPTNSGSDTLHALKNSGITLSAAGSSKLGVSFTPSSASAIYLVTAVITVEGSITTSDYLAAQLWDGTTTIALASANVTASTAYVYSITLTGIYAPGTASAVTLTVRTASGSGTCTTAEYSGIATPAMFTIVQIV